MPKPKRPVSPSAPPGPSKRSRLSRAQSHALSQMSTDTETSETRPTQAQAAIVRVNSYKMSGREDEEQLKPGLLACIEWLPKDGCDSLVRDILNATTDDLLYSVFQNILTALVKPMKTASKNTSVTESPHPKRQQNAELVAGTLDESQSRKKEFRTKILKRDSFRCVLTDTMDEGHWASIGSPYEIDAYKIEAAHIIPFAYGNWKSPSDPPDKIWEALYRLFPRVRRVLRAEEINAPFNGICLEKSMHDLFGGFRIALVHTETPNVYKRKTYPSYPRRYLLLLPDDTTVKFSSSEDPDFAPPHPDLLETHWRLAEILNASGMAEVVEKHQQEWEDCEVSALNPNGSTDVGSAVRMALWGRVEC